MRLLIRESFFISSCNVKISGELYVEDLAERRTVSIRMGWLWVEGTPMRLPLRALNLRQASPNLCQPHPFALGFTLSNPQGHSLATFWVICETILLTLSWNQYESAGSDLWILSTLYSERLAIRNRLTLYSKDIPAVVSEPRPAQRNFSRARLDFASAESIRAFGMVPWTRWDGMGPARPGRRSSPVGAAVTVRHERSTLYEN